MSTRAMAIAAVCGVVIGVAYTLSPLGVWFVLAFAVLCRVAIRDLSVEERRIVFGMLVVAAVLRLAVVAGLFLTTDHFSVPFGSLFGDEEYFKRRSMWLRSMALDVDISIADKIYATDEYSDTSYLYLLALVQVLVGDAPYGVHAFSILLYLVGAVILYRFVRQSFGSAPATVSLGLVLFLPTLFLWSVSALRESIHFMLTMIAIVGGLKAAGESHGVARRIGWALAAFGATLALRDLRAGSMQVVAVSLAAGLAGSLLARRPRLLTATVLAAVVAGTVALTRPQVQDRMMTMVRESAMTHQGHVFTPGLHYKLLDSKYYLERRMGVMERLTGPEAARFVVRALVAAILVPLPWQAESRFIQAYLPEQFVWYGLVLLLPLGVWTAWRCRPAATLVLTTYVLLTGTAIALRSGNVGTLVRHRGLILPFVICLTSVGICHALARGARFRRSAPMLAVNERTV